MTRLTKKRIMAISGTTLCGCSVGILQDSSLGLDPFSCFVTGIANIFGSSYGTFYLIVTSILLLVVIFLKRNYLGYTTLANLLLTGIIADYTLAFFEWFCKSSNIFNSNYTITVRVRINVFSSFAIFYSSIRCISI